MATITYAFENTSVEQIVEAGNSGSESHASIVANGQGGALVTYDRGGGADVGASSFDANGAPLYPTATVNTTKTGTQLDSHTAARVNGFVTAFTDTSGPVDTIRVVLSGADGSPLVSDVVVSDSAQYDQYGASVASLADGGFVVTWTKDFGNGDLDIRAQRFNWDGSARGDLITVDSDSALKTTDSAVAGLADGGFVTAWTQSAKGGGAESIVLQRYDAAGAAVGGHVTIDNYGTQNSEVQLLGLKNGGYAVAYADNGWDAASGRDVTLRIFNADGSPRTSFLRVNADTLKASGAGDTDGDQGAPTLTQLSNGAIVVGWTSSNAGTIGSDIHARAFDANGTPLTGVEALANAAGDQLDVSLAGLGGGALGMAWTSHGGVGSPLEVRYSETELVRTTLGTSAADQLTGDDLRDRMNGGAEADSLDALGGADELTGGAGNDSLHGGFGDDTLSGGTDSDILWGEGGNDEIFGGAGNDTLDGSFGADTMTGGGGDELYLVDDAGDRVIEKAGGGTDHVYSYVSFSLAGQELENLVFFDNGENINATGNGLANLLVGNSGKNVLNGGAGADTMSGGKGDDTYVVDNAGDEAFENAGGGTDKVVSSISFSLAGLAIEKLTLNGSANSNGVGNGLANTLAGNGGDNMLNGAAGLDTIFGGAGDDTFVFSTALGASNVDHLQDFAAADDAIRLHKSVFDALGTGALAATAFKDLAVGAADANDRILYDHDTGKLFYDADGSGAAHAAKQIAVLDNHALLTANDFFVV